MRGCGSQGRSGLVKAGWDYGASPRLRAPRPRAATPKPDEGDWSQLLALMNPSLGLNVSSGLPMPVAGNVAFIAQSGSLASTIVDWSHKGIVGFSAFVSLGDIVDVGWGNLIDYFGADWATRAIVVHMESIANMRSFLSAARAVALQKPIIVTKAGRTEAAAHAFSWHRSCPRQRRRGARGSASTRGGDPRRRHRRPLSRRRCTVEAAAPEGVTPDDCHQRRRARRVGCRPGRKCGNSRSPDGRAI